MEFENLKNNKPSMEEGSTRQYNSGTSFISPKSFSLYGSDEAYTFGNLM